MNGHIAEQAELYALGTLDERERIAVDRHVATCPACARRLGQAEETVAALIKPVEFPAEFHVRIHKTTTRKWFMPLALTAALVIGLLPSALTWQSVREERALSAQDAVAEQALVTSHFAHAPFAPVAPGAPVAKVLFGRNAPWRYFIAQTSRRYTVAAVSHGSVESIGTLQVRGNVGTLFVPRPPKAQEYRIMDGPATIAVARLH